MTSPEPPWRVLLVDDEPALRSLLRLLLDRTGRHEVVGEAGDGLEALERAAAVVPDLVLLDLSMPRMDGLEALPQLRRLLPNMRVIVLSGFATDAAAEAARRAGAHGYVQKGLPPADLLAALDTVMGRTPVSGRPTPGR